MRLLNLLLHRYRSVDYAEFDAGPFTVLFGKNNAGKSNILEGLYLAFSDDDATVARGPEDGLPAEGAFTVELERDVSFDDSAGAAVFDQVSGAPAIRLSFVSLMAANRGLTSELGLVVGDPRDLVELTSDSDLRDGVEVEYTSADVREWRDHLLNGPNLHLLFLNWEYADLQRRIEPSVAKIAKSWLDAMPSQRSVDPRRRPPEPFDPETISFRLSESARRTANQLSSLATDLLPDFIEGSIGVRLTDPRGWLRGAPKFDLVHENRPGERWSHAVSDSGNGIARWMAASLQIALHLLAEYPDIMTLRDVGAKEFSGHILLVDEPEAHLHPSAVASVVRWCQRMVRHGFTVVAASHHDEFLRVPGDQATLIHVTRNAKRVYSAARTLPASTISRLQELASDVGLHPATTLSLHRAILFVEGTLDEAVLDEYGGLQLDAAGVKILPMHGTKNIEGIVAAEVVTELGIKLGILTDATDTATMAEKSNKKRSSEEKKVLQVLEIARRKELAPPMVFGVREADLLHALPVDAIREYLKGPFPDWDDLVPECREILGKGPSDSVNWKLYAREHYGLPIDTAEGVRSVVRALDLQNVQLPSIQTVIDEIVTWATR